MNFFIIGPTGSIGSVLVPTAVRAGHKVVGLVRSKDSEQRLASFGASPVRGDMTEPDTWIEEAARADVLVQLGAVSPKRSNEKWLRGGSDAHRAASEGLLAAARRNGTCRAMITASAVYVSGSHGEEWIDESTPAKPHLLARFWAPNEEIVAQARAHGIAATALRFGQVYAANPDGTFGKFFLKMAAKGRFRYMGSGDNFYPYVHVDDAVDAIMKVAESPPGDSVINIVDDEPLRMRESAEMLLRAFGNKAKPMPVWLGKLFVGKPLVEGFTGSYRVKNDRAKNALGWTPRHPSFRGQIGAVVDEYRRLTGLPDTSLGSPGLESN